MQKLRQARERKRLTAGRCEGRKPIPDDIKALARPFCTREIQRRARGYPTGEFPRLWQKQAIQGQAGRSDGPESVKRMLARSRQG